MEKFGLVVFDEVHHAVKASPMSPLAIHIKEKLTEERKPRLLGLTASFANTGSHDGIYQEKTAKKFCLEVDPID